MICIDVMSTWCGIVPLNGCIHSEQVWVSGYEPYRNNQMTAILTNIPRDMSIDIILILRGVVPQIDWIHSQQVWFPGHKRYWTIQMTSIFMNSLPDTICIDVNSAWRDVPFKMSPVRRYEFQVINVIGTMKWWPYLSIHHRVWLVSRECRLCGICFWKRFYPQRTGMSFRLWTLLE